MSSFVFNDFKKRYLNGEVPSKDTWTFIPVNDTFKTNFEFGEIRLDHYRSISDFKDVSNTRGGGLYFDYSGSKKTNHIGKESYADILNDNFRLFGNTLYAGVPVTYKWTKVIDDGELNNKPMFVTLENYENFLGYYKNTVDSNLFITEYLNRGGFYFIRSKDELEWFAERSNTNNTIIGVLGDNIEGVINKPIGANEDKPFNGILDGNYFTFDISVKAQSTDNGVVGVLGPFGVVRNFVLVNTHNVNSIDCEIPITLSHIKNDGRDINCGLLVGRNYGFIHNIDAKNLNAFNIYGCVPSVYSVTNKSDDYKWNETEKIVRKKFDEKNENFMYLNSYCINSPGNICPYVGYFNEGKFADDAVALATDTMQLRFSANYATNYSAYFANWKPTNVQTSIDHNITASIAGVQYFPLGNFEATTDDSQSIIKHTGPLTTINTFIKNPLYYGVDNFGFYTVRGLGNSSNSATWTENYNSNLLQKTWGDAYATNTALSPSYEFTRCSMRLHPQARAAYNVGIIIGANYGTASNIQVSAVVRNTSNFVGFIGGIAGKQANGEVNNVTVYMDNEFVYDFGNKPEYGDVVYYKQTPFFPEPVKSYLESKLQQGTAPTQNTISMLCKAWYDDTRDDAATLTKTVNTATTVTDDVIAYKLRPIFVVGGLFGRYIPTYGSDINYKPMKCFVNNSTVLYKDNYYATVDSNYKRAENAFGVIIGKVDYASTTNSFYFDASMACNNCKFSALSTVGEPFRVFANYFDENSHNWIPITSASTEQGKVVLNSAMSNARYVGIYEIKNNLMDSVSYTVNGAYTALSNPVSDTSKKSLTNIGVYWGADYPIDVSSHYGGITKSFELNGFQIPDNDFYWTTTDGQTPYTWGPYNILHDKLFEPNFDPTTYTGGYNKRNMASKLINLFGCYSNVDGWINIYDNYMNNWNYMEIPSYFSAHTAFTPREVYQIQKYWNRMRTHYNGYTNNTARIAEDLEWDVNAGGDFSAVSGLYTEGLLPRQINQFNAAGTQNALDGYTTVDFLHFGWYDIDSFNDQMVGVNYGAGQPLSYFYARELNCNIYLASSFKNPRRYKKDILHHFNPTFYAEPIEAISWQDQLSPFPARSKDDTYFYYTYSSSAGEYNDVNKAYVTLDKAFAFQIPVEFTAHHSNFGYATTANTENPYITIGEYFTPSEIRQKLNTTTLKDENGYRYFTSTSVSSNENFGGLLVIDSSGRNVMFMDNENNMPITGNTVAFSTESIMINTKREKKVVLSVV